MKRSSLIAVGLLVLFAVANGAQAGAFSGSNDLESVHLQGMDLLPSLWHPSSLESRYTRDTIDDGVNTYGNCTNSATCGSSWVRKVFVGPNCQSSAQTYYEKLSNGTSTDACESIPFPNPSIQASRLQVCDKGMNALGAWFYIGSATCPSSRKAQFTGYNLGTCINTNSSNPLDSSLSFAVYCSFRDASSSKPSASYPAFAASVINETKTGCPNNAPSCDKIAYRAEWNDSDTCQANASDIAPLFTGMVTGTCYQTGDISLPDTVNYKISCLPTFVKIGSYGRGCASSALTTMSIYNTQICLDSTLSGGGLSSSRFYCKYTSAAPSAYLASPILLMFALSVLALL